MNDSYKKKQIESVLSTIDDGFDRYGDIAIDDCKMSMRKSIYQWSIKPIKSPLAFGDVVVTEPYKDSTKSVCFSHSVELLKNIVKNVYGGGFAAGLNEFFIEDGSAEELLKRIYPTSFSWLYDKHGALPVSGSYTAPIPMTEDLEYALSPSRYDRSDYIEEMRDVPLPGIFDRVTGKSLLPSLDTPEHIVRKRSVTGAQEDRYEEEVRVYLEHLEQTDEKEMNEEERKDKDRFIRKNVLTTFRTGMTEQGYEELKEELREYMTPEELREIGAK